MCMVIINQTIIPNKIKNYRYADTTNIPDMLEHMCNGVVNPITKETITKYKTILEDPLLRDICLEAMAKELGRLTQGYKYTQVTNTLFFMDHHQIQNIPKYRTVTYVRIVIDYRPQK